MITDTASLLMPPPSCPPPSPQAEQLKAAGNSKFEQRIYRDAFALYSKAINLAPEVRRAPPHTHTLHEEPASLNHAPP